MDEVKQFFQALFPNLDGEYIEVRPFLRGEPDNEHRAFLKTVDEFIEHVKKIPKDRDIYYGIATRIKPGKGTADNCRTYNFIGLDYDLKDNPGLTELKLVEKFLELGIKPTAIVNSGNGFHAYIKINPCTDQGTVARITKEIALSTRADLKAIKPTQILRVPGTVNNKNKPTPVTIVHKDYTIQYSTEQLKILLGIKENKKNQPDNNMEIDLQNIDRPCIRSMLKGVEEGQRNFALGRLTKYFQVKGKTKKETLKIILAWNQRNMPPENRDKLVKDFHAYWHGDYKLLGCAINKPELQQLLSIHCNKPECMVQATIGRLKLDNTVKYNNRLFKNYKDITGNDLIIYGVLLKYKKGLNTNQLIEKLYSKKTDGPCVSRKTLLKSINTLKKLGLIEVKEGNKKAGIPNFYKAVPQGTFGLGYTVVTNGAIMGAIHGIISPAQFKLYVLLLKYAFNKGNCYPSTVTLAKELNVTQPAVSANLKELEKVGYIDKKVDYSKGYERLIFTLLI